MSFTDSWCAAREHSYQLLYVAGDCIGGMHTSPCKKEHTQIINVNLVIDTYCKL